VPVVVDRGALRVDAQLQRLDHGGAQRLDLCARQLAHRPQWVDPRAKERLVGVDVADAGDPLLVEQEGLDRLLAPAGERAQRVGREVDAERLHP
jgi:hypothetical protein